MRHVAAYLMLVLGGNDAPTGEDVSKLLESVGVSTCADSVAKLIAELEGKDLAEVIAAGKEKLAAVPSGAGASAGTSAGAAAGAETAAVEEEVVEEEEEEDFGGGGGLFGGSDSGSDSDSD